MKKEEKIDIKVNQWMQRALIDLKQKYIDRTTDALNDKANLEEELEKLKFIRLHDTTHRKAFIESDLKTIQKDIKKYFDYMNAIQRRIDKLPI
tara:strand:+ start:65 stop:343 length:279 start_codon:yes stop_codon:yes gene_type:complete